MKDEKYDLREDIAPQMSDSVINTGIAMLLCNETPVPLHEKVLGQDCNLEIIREVLRYNAYQREIGEKLEMFREGNVNIPEYSHLSGEPLNRFYRHVEARVRAELIELDS